MILSLLNIPRMTLWNVPDILLHSNSGSTELAGFGGQWISIFLVGLFIATWIVAERNSAGFIRVVRENCTAEGFNEKRQRHEITTRTSQ